MLKISKFIQTTNIFFQVFTAIFTLECIIKLVALGKSYFRRYWNVFDLVVVIISFIDIIIELIPGIKNFAFRVVRLVSYYKYVALWSLSTICR